jgi:hypothetical protein
MAQIVDGLDLALSLPWSCSPRSKAKPRPRHAAKARHLAMLLQRRKHVKRGVPRQCWSESLPAQCVIRPTVQKSMCFGERAFRVGGRDGSGTRARHGYRAKPRDERHAKAPCWPPPCTRKSLRIRTRLRRLERRVDAATGCARILLRWRSGCRRTVAAACRRAVVRVKGRGLCWFSTSRPQRLRWARHSYDGVHALEFPWGHEPMRSAAGV